MILVSYYNAQTDCLSYQNGRLRLEAQLVVSSQFTSLNDSQVLKIDDLTIHLVQLTNCCSLGIYCLQLQQPFHQRLHQIKTYTHHDITDQLHKVYWCAPSSCLLTTANKVYRLTLDTFYGVQSVDQLVGAEHLFDLKSMPE